MPKCKAPDCNKTYKRDPPGDMRITWCSIDCALILARHRQDRAHEKAAGKARRERINTAKANRKAVRDLNRKSLGWQHKQTQPVFNKLRRLQEFKWFRDRGIEPYCISCRKTHMDWACGHFISVSAGSSMLRYDPLNTWLQCNKYCNSAKSSNRAGYEEGLVIRFGESRGREIIDYCKARTGPLKVTCDELEAMRGGFSAKIRVLEKLLA